MSVAEIIDELAVLADKRAADEPAPADEAPAEPPVPAPAEAAAAAEEAAPGDMAGEVEAAGGLSRATKTDAVRAQAVDVHPPKPLEKRAYAGVRGLFLGAARLWFRLEVHGAEKLPEAPFIVAPVHRSNVDFLLSATITKPRMRYMGKASIWKSKALGRFVSMLGAFPVHRGTADRESLRTCLRVLEQGESLVMFPEGTRQSGPKVQELFDGTAYVALKAGVPVVPLGIGGTEAAMPQGAKFVKPKKVVLVVGDPIDPPDTGGKGRAPRRAVRELTQQLHTAIQAAFDDAMSRVD
jgi:1-acyl-sn-glycerol-3-phosphate acyltransferase